MPPVIASRFTTGEAAVLAVVAREVQRSGRCEFYLDKIAALAGVCRSTAQNALAKSLRAAEKSPETPSSWSCSADPAQRQTEKEKRSRAFGLGEHEPESILWMPAVHFLEHMLLHEIRWRGALDAADLVRNAEHHACGDQGHHGSSPTRISPLLHTFCG